MCTITATELKEHFGKYMKLGQQEEINVTHRGKLIFSIVPNKEKRIKDLQALFGTLPREVYFDDNVDRE